MRLVEQFGRALADPVFYVLLLVTAVQLLLPYWLQRELLSRIDAERRARAWNPLSWSSAVIWLGPLSMIPFAWVTRRDRSLSSSAFALAWGTLSALALLAAGYLLDRLFASASG